MTTKLKPSKSFKRQHPKLTFLQPGYFKHTSVFFKAKIVSIPST